MIVIPRPCPRRRPCLEVRGRPDRAVRPLEAVECEHHVERPRDAPPQIVGRLELSRRLRRQDRRIRIEPGRLGQREQTLDAVVVPFDAVVIESSEAWRVGKAWGSTSRTRGPPYD